MRVFYSSWIIRIVNKDQMDKEKSDEMLNSKGAEIGSFNDSGDTES